MKTFRAGQSIAFTFNTNKFSDGTLVTFAGAAVKMFRGTDTTGSNTGLTLSIDTPGTGIQSVAIDPLTAAAYLLPGNVYDVRVSTADTGALFPIYTKVAEFCVASPGDGVEYVLSANAATGGTATDNGLLAYGDVGDVVVVKTGTYPGQPRTITAWNKGTGVFTVSPNFDNAPGNVSVTIYPQAPATATPPVVNVTQVNGTAVTAGDVVAIVNAIKTKTDSLTFTVANQVDANALKLGGTTQTGADVGGIVAAIKTKTDSLTFTVANQVDANALKLGGTTQTGADVGSIAAAIKTKTDSLTFTVAGLVDANLKYVTGAGTLKASGTGGQSVGT